MCNNSGGVWRSTLHNIRWRQLLLQWQRGIHFGDLGDEKADNPRTDRICERWAAQTDGCLSSIFPYSISISLRHWSFTIRNRNKSDTVIRCGHERSIVWCHWGAAWRRSRWSPSAAESKNPLVYWAELDGPARWDPESPHCFWLSIWSLLLKSCKIHFTLFISFDM